MRELLTGDTESVSFGVDSLTALQVRKTKPQQQKIS